MSGKGGNPGWKKGQSGNPGGRRKQDYRIKDLAQEHTEPALKMIRSIMDDPKTVPSVKLAAANALLDRGYGKPAQTIDATITRTDAVDMTDAELLDIARGGSDGAAEETGSAAEPPELH